MTNLTTLMSPGSIAVIGASRNKQHVGARILNNIIQSKFLGSIFPVNPKSTELNGYRCYPSLGEIKEKVDLAIIAVPADSVEAVLLDCISAKVPAAIIITAGFAEVSIEGKRKQEHLIQLARAANIRLLGPNCLGLLNTDPLVSLNATFAEHQVIEGNIAVASQSGAIGLLLLDYLSKQNIGVSSFVSIGNRADVSSNDLLEYWESDKRTKVIILYLESLGNIGRFLEIARRVSMHKPIVALKAGRSKSGARAAASHSAAAASESRYVRALFAKAGIIEAESAEELLDIATYFAETTAPQGNGVAIITNGGGPAIMLADALEARGQTVPVFSALTQEKLKTFLPPAAAVQNPVDMLPSATASDYSKALNIVAEDPNIQSVAVMHIPLGKGSVEELQIELPKTAHSLAVKPVVTVLMSSTLPTQSKHAHLSNYLFPESAATVLAKSFAYSKWKSRSTAAAFSFDDGTVKLLREACLKIPDKNTNGPSTNGWLSNKTVSKILNIAGIALPNSVEFSKPPAVEELRNLDYPTVVKLLAPDLIHKQDIGGVRMGIKTPEQLQSCIQELSAKANQLKIIAPYFLVQTQLPSRIEAFIGAVRDPEFGPVLLLGFGGKYVQLLDDIAPLIPPLNKEDIEQALHTLKFNSLLQGFRGDPPGDRNALIDVTLRISALMQALPEISELDLNPVLVQEPNQGAVVVDARIRCLDEQCAHTTLKTYAVGVRGC